MNNNSLFFEGYDFSNPKQIVKYLSENQDTILSIRAGGVQILRDGDCVHTITDKSCIDASQIAADAIAKKQKGSVPLPKNIDLRDLKQTRNQGLSFAGLFTLADVALTSGAVLKFQEFVSSNSQFDQNLGNVLVFAGGIALCRALYHGINGEDAEKDAEFLESLKNNPIEKA